jgi:putative ABC transport system permease protein
MSGYAMFTKIVLRSLIRRRSRMLVALLAITLGSTVFLGMGTIYYDIPRQMGRELRSYGANLVLLPADGNAVLTLENAAKASALLPRDKLIGAAPFRYGTMYYNMQGLTVVGTDFDAARKTSPYWRVHGAWPNRDDEVLVGTDISEHARLYAGSSVTLEIAPPGGRRFKKELKIAGIVRTGGPEDGFILMPMSTLERLMGAEGTANLVEISLTATGEELARAEETIRAGVPGVVPRPVKRIADSETTVLAKLKILVYLVTAVVLSLTMICVGTTMMTVVMERRGEIGLKKALGAGNTAVIAEFMGESTALALAGGCAGVFCGRIFAQIVSTSVFMRGVEPPLSLVLLTLCASLAVTVLASALPVAVAAEIEPALVLRGE